MSPRPKTSKWPTYVIWRGMIARCFNPKTQSYRNYGGRGITVAKRWLRFENFLADMGEKPDGTTLDRRNNHLGYSRRNCRWATLIEQHRNRRDNRVVTYRGKTRCIAEWAEILGIPDATLRVRLFRLNWSVRKTMTTPIRGYCLRGERSSNNE